MITKHIDKKELEIKWGEINEHSDHVPIYISYKAANTSKIMDSTKIMVRNQKKMKWKSRELLYDLFKAESNDEISTAFERCNERRIGM